MDGGFLRLTKHTNALVHCKHHVLERGAGSFFHVAVYENPHAFFSLTSSTPALVLTLPRNLPAPLNLALAKVCVTPTLPLP